MRVYNFAAGPSMLPMPVLEQAQKELMDYNGSGMSVMEMSHRSKTYMAINDEANALLRELMRIPDNYKVLFIQGGASQQFAACALNLMNKSRKADYVITGNFANQAAKEARRFGEVRVVASSEDANYTYIPDITPEMISDDADYVHITTNNTIYGTKYTVFPDTKGIPLAADMSSNILSEEVDVSRFGLIYAGAQKNIGPAGMTVVIVRDDLIGKERDICPTMLKYSIQAEKNSLYNTPPAYSTYVAMLVFRYLKSVGGVSAIHEINVEKARMLYDFIDNSALYTNSVRPKDRSIMNVPFVTPSAELNEKFVKEATAAGLVSLKGHRLVGGMRASIYNAMPVEGVKALIAFMKKFEMENK
ncbi:MAG: 3-phosphoserine/phosphohydroxythreonine transaminase [Eubacteriales bacterium]|nr:3-phosphoserine/phosphohydroxythreonine transaminase [Eubacteriales bacterium]